MMQSNTINESDGNVFRPVKSFADLPPEMVIAIFIHVDTSDLLNFRRVNRQWNAISTEIMRNRDDITLCFKRQIINFIQRIPHRHPEKLFLFERNRTSTPGLKNLNDLVACLQNCKRLRQFPCTAFQFDGISDVLGEDMQNFLKIFGDNIRSLKVELRNGKCNEILQDILKSTPNLKKIEIWSDDSFDVPLSVIGISVDPHRTLLNLDVLSVDYFHKNHPKIIEDILTMSPNLKRVSFGDLDDITAEDLQMLESTNKLDCLKTLHIYITKDIIAHWKKSLKCFDLQLESLDVNIFAWDIVNPQLKLDAIKIVNQLCRSSKDVMHTLRLSSFSLLSELQLPKLEKLRTLSVNEEFPIVPPLLNWLTSFPNIKELSVNLIMAPFGSLKPQQISLPSVEVVRIGCNGKSDILNLIKMTPNAQTLLIDDAHSFWLDDIIVSFEEIPLFVPKLVNFGWQMREPNSHLQHKLDAVLTGLSEDLCKELAEKFRNKDDRLSAREIAAYQRGRVGSSIVDLKGLRQLEFLFITLPTDDEMSRMMKVSKLLGFDLIPGLKVFINRSLFSETKHILNSLSLSE